MKRSKIFNQWENPSIDLSNHRVIHIGNLPDGCCWRDIKVIFKDYYVEFSHFFGNQALIQFKTPQEAHEFIKSNKVIKPYNAPVEFSFFDSLIYDDFESIPGASRVICVQVTHLRLYLGIYDIYDQCSLFGVVDKIICFEKGGKFALVQMHTVQEAGLALYNLSNSQRHLPSFQLRIQFSKNQDIAIKFNNTKSFDFTQIGSRAEFEHNRESAMSELGFFEPERESSIPSEFDLFRPIDFDPVFSHSIIIRGYHETNNPCDTLRNLLQQYGFVISVRCTVSRGPSSLAIVQMRDEYQARLAAYMMNGCPFQNDVLTTEVIQGNEQPSLGIEISRKYPVELNKPNNYWFPSKKVRIFPETIDVSSILSELKVQCKKNGSVLTFDSVSDASYFIAKNSMKTINNQTLYLCFNDDT